MEIIDILTKTKNLKIELIYSLILGIVLSVLFISCTGNQISEASILIENEENIADLHIDEFYLSPGDEIEISVYKYEGLSKRLKIPPDGTIFFPIVGELNANNKSLKEIRQIIIQGLSGYKEQRILPGDEISISVFLHEEYDRQFIVPSDGFIFFPYVGEISVETKNLREIRDIIAEGIEGYVNEPQVIIDIVKSANPLRIVNPQVNIEIISYLGHKVIIMGEVNHPGIYAIGGNIRLLDGLAMAGGLTEAANGNGILLIRSRGHGKKPLLVRLSFDQFIKQGDYEQNPLIIKNDIVFVHTSAIANIDKFFEHFKKVVSPLLDIETGIWIGQNIIEGPGGGIRTNP